VTCTRTCRVGTFRRSGKFARVGRSGLFDEETRVGKRMDEWIVGSYFGRVTRVLRQYKADFWFGTKLWSDALMICERCHAREATVHLTEVTGQDLRKIDLCESCCQDTRPGLLEKAKRSASYPPPRTRGLQGPQGPETK
jgi:hypothetical protein